MLTATVSDTGLAGLSWIKGLKTAVVFVVVDRSRESFVVDIEINDSQSQY